MKTKVVIGCFETTPCCTECEWFSQPLLAFDGGAIPVPRLVCPDCGAPVLLAVGQYKIKTTKTLFSSRREYIGFIRRDTEQACPAPVGAIGN